MEKQRGHNGPLREFQTHRDALAIEARAEGLEPGINLFRAMFTAQKLPLFSASGLEADIVVRISPVEANKGRTGCGCLVLHGRSPRGGYSGAKGQACWRSAKA